MKLQKCDLDQNEKYYPVQNKVLFHYKVISLILLTRFYKRLFWNGNAIWKLQVWKLYFQNRERKRIAIFNVHFLFLLPSFDIQPTLVVLVIDIGVFLATSQAPLKWTSASQ